MLLRGMNRIVRTWFVHAFLCPPSFTSSFKYSHRYYPWTTISGCDLTVVSVRSVKLHTTMQTYCWNLTFNIVKFILSIGSIFTSALFFLDTRVVMRCLRDLLLMVHEGWHYNLLHSHYFSSHCFSFVCIIYANKTTYTYCTQMTARY